MTEFAFIVYLMVVFSIITDLFRDRQVSGLAKALWLLLPFLTAFVYVVTRDGGLAKRTMEAPGGPRVSVGGLHPWVAGGANPTAQIAHAKTMLDSGAITQSEFESLKRQALGQGTSLA